MRAPLTLALTALALGLTPHAPAPFSTQQMGIDTNAPEEVQQRQIQEFVERDQVARQQAAESRAQAVEQAQLARVARNTTPPELARQVAAAHTQRQAAADSAPAPEEPRSSVAGWLSVLALAGVMAWGIRLARRQAAQIA